MDTYKEALSPWRRCLKYCTGLPLSACRCPRPSPFLSLSWASSSSRISAEGSERGTHRIFACGRRHDRADAERYLLLPGLNRKNPKSDLSLSRVGLFMFLEGSQPSCLFIEWFSNFYFIDRDFLGVILVSFCFTLNFCEDHITNMIRISAFLPVTKAVYINTCFL